uniref:Uncharacterized protein n=1 Tax=Rousettus aegyptiacus TaxID=9407 RepID=A0A7J8C2P2_ROUAE|nr:hypothetical protein HJG63_009433 [Rousettus aegyptiacus]
MPDAGPGEEAIALRVEAASLCARRSDSAPTTRTLLGAHVSARGVPQARRVEGAVGEPRVGGRRGSGLQTRNRAQAFWRPCRRVRRRRPGVYGYQAGVSPQPPPQVQQRFLPQGHAQIPQRLVKGAESCATAPLPNPAVPPSPAPCPAVTVARPLALSEAAAAARSRSHTREMQTSRQLLSDDFAAAAAPNGVGADSRVSSCASATLATLGFARPSPPLSPTPRPAAPSRGPTSPPYPENAGRRRSGRDGHLLGLRLLAADLNAGSG